MSHCNNCEMLVATDFHSYFEWTDRLDHYYGGEECGGEYELDEVGSFLETENNRWQIGVRIDTCSNCGEFIEMRTFSRINNVE